MAGTWVQVAMYEIVQEYHIQQMITAQSGKLQLQLLVNLWPHEVGDRVTGHQGLHERVFLDEPFYRL